MKKFIYLSISILFTMITNAQDRPMPKSGPVPVVNVNKPMSFKLSNGLKVLVVENNKLPRVSYRLTLDNPPYFEGDKKGFSDLLSAMIGNATQKMSKEKFNEEIDFLGASFNFNSNGASATGLSRYASKLLELLADGALNPLFTQEDFDSEKKKMIEGIKSDEKNVSKTRERVTDALVYGKNHYKGEFISEASLNKVSLQDVKNCYNTYFVPGNAYLVVVGDVKINEVKAKVEELFGLWKAAKAPNLTYSDPKDVQYSQINFIDMPNAVQSEIAVANLSKSNKKDKDYFAALLADQILGGGGEGRLFLNLREKHGWTYGSYSNLEDGKYISKFSATAQVRNMVTDSAVVEILKEVKRIRTELVSDEELRNAKALYIGNFVMQMEKPATIARYALNIETLGLPEDYYQNYIKNINAVTAQELKAAAEKYFKYDNLRIVIVGKAADVLTKLEEMSKREKLPILYFDKNANPIEKPSINKPLPKDITAQSVLKKYIDNIGGEKAISAIKSIYTKQEATVQGMKLLAENKKMNNRSHLKVTVNGAMVANEVLIGNTKGFESSMAGKKEFTPEELKKRQADELLFEELNLLKSTTLKIEGIEQINGSDAYAILNGTKKNFYDVKSGFKVATEVEREVKGQKLKSKIYMSDYQLEKNGVKFPYKMVMEAGPGMMIDLNVVDIKVNESVSEKDFD